MQNELQERKRTKSYVKVQMMPQKRSHQPGHRMWRWARAVVGEGWCTGDEAGLGGCPWHFSNGQYGYLSSLLSGFEFSRSMWFCRWRSFAALSSHPDSCLGLASVPSPPETYFPSGLTHYSLCFMSPMMLFNAQKYLTSLYWSLNE